MKLAVLFPGVGYHTDKPLLYYSRRLAKNAGYEVAEVSYTNIVMKRDSSEEKKLEEFFNAYRQAKETLCTIEFDKYDDILFISKSIGTIIATAYAKENNLKVRQILYTPLEKTFEFVQGDTIAFTGTKDPWVDYDRIVRAAKETKVPLYITENANHSLETGDPVLDVQNMNAILTTAGSYIEQETISAPHASDKECSVMVDDRKEDMHGEEYMRRAIELAGRAVGHTNPNPLVGAVIVKDGHIIGEGYHRQIGSLHAERNALANCTQSPEGATIYVTLEPCCHYGKTPPCTEAIIENKLAKVVIGSRDPNPKVAGKGVIALREAGIEVIENYLREECDAVNPVFFQYIREKQPYVALKYAMTADGKIATKTGDSMWITGEESRKSVQVLRNYYKGIMVGIGTVLADDPMLTCRMETPVCEDYDEEKDSAGYYGRNPIRIVCDSHLQIPPDSRLCNSTELAPVIVACLEPENEQAEEKMKTLQEKGVQVMVVHSQDGHIDVRELMTRLGEQGIDGILVEGGGTLNEALIKAGLVHHIYAYVGAQIFGGVSSYTPVSGVGVEKVADSLKLTNPKVRVIEQDVLIEYDVCT